MTITHPAINKWVGVLYSPAISSCGVGFNQGKSTAVLTCVADLFPPHFFLITEGPLRVCTLSCGSLQPHELLPSSSSVRGIFLARILEWVAISSSRGSSQLRDQTWVSCHSCIGKRILYHLATWESMAPSTTYLNLTSFDISLSPQPWFWGCHCLIFFASAFFWGLAKWKIIC